MRNEPRAESMSIPLWLIGLFQILVSLFLVGQTAIMRQPDRVRWTLHTLAYGMVIGFMWAVARWDIATIHLRTILPVLFLVASLLSYRRITAPKTPPRTIQTLIVMGTNGLLIVLLGGFNWLAFRGYSVPEGTVDLSSPLRGSRSVVVHGGASPFINGHARVRPQTYALDILGLNVLGRSARAFGSRRELESFTIFGASIYSPCAGTVAAAVDNYEDLIPPTTDPEHPAGNHVLVECGDVEVLLAHMKQGSVSVQVGTSVTVDTVLGQVGNTGNTSEPHLHVHAERGGEPGVVLDGEAVPITIEGRFLVRGDVLRER